MVPQGQSELQKGLTRPSKGHGSKDSSGDSKGFSKEFSKILSSRGSSGFLGPPVMATFDAKKRDCWTTGKKFKRYLKYYKMQILKCGV